MSLNIITNNTYYVTFDFYNSVGTLTHTLDIFKLKTTTIQTYPNKKSEDKIGVVLVQTITQLDASAENSIIELNPINWALSTSSTVPITDAATLRATLLGYFSSNW